MRDIPVSIKYGRIEYKGVLKRRSHHSVNMWNLICELSDNEEVCIARLRYLDDGSWKIDETIPNYIFWEQYVNEVGNQVIEFTKRERS